MSPQPNRFADDVLAALRQGDPGRDRLLEILQAAEVRSLRLQFSDLTGALRQVDIPSGRFAGVLDGSVPFDASAVGGFVRQDEAEVLLRPDPRTLRLVPWCQGPGRAARMICDVMRPDGTPFEGDPRGVLSRVIRELEDEGFRSAVGAEIELFLFPMGEGGANRQGEVRFSAGDAVRQEIVEGLEAMGIDVASAHADAAPGQHEISLLPADALSTADHLATLGVLARDRADAHGLRATFMPKPLFGENGSGLHLHHSLFRGEANALSDPEAMDGLSEVLRGFVGGLIGHARGFAAVTNPLVNSYKRLVPGHSAPVHGTWSLQEGSPLVRIPHARGQRTTCEVRLADAAANPFLALAVQLAAGLDGIRREADPGAPVAKGLSAMSARELQRRRIPLMPRHLGEALQALEEDRVIRAALGEYVFSRVIEEKRREWEEYVAQVHPWELDRYSEV